MDVDGRNVYVDLMSSKRDKAYYEARLKGEHPTLFADVVCGKLALWDAVYQTGLKPRPTPLKVLKQKWRKAAPAERDLFLQWLASEYGITCVVGTPAVGPSASAPTSGAVPAPAPTPVPAPTPNSGPAPVARASRSPGGASGSSIVDASGRLLPGAKHAISRIMAARGIKLGTIMKEIGEQPLNTSLGSALARDTALHDPDLIKKLEAWLKKHGYSFP